MPQGAGLHQGSASAETIWTRNNISGRFSTRFLRCREHRQVSAIASDANGNTYVTGSRAVAVSASSQGWLNDIFVSKLDPDGNLTLLATLSGKGSDQVFGIALDPSGNIYIVGSTSSPDFPLHHPLQSTAYQGSETGFLVKLSADGANVLPVT